MKKAILILVFTTLFGLASNYAQQHSAPQPDAITGIWINSSKDAKFEIFKKENKYFGKIIWGTGSESKDAKNPDVNQRNKDLIGLVILKKIEFDGKNTWKNGTIYDPKNGKTYSCKLSMAKPNKLEVRGFVGFSLFGRTEIWNRVLKK